VKRGAVILACLAMLFAAAAVSRAEVIVGPVGEEEEQEGKEESQLPEAVLFERLGIRIVRKGPVNPDAESAPELVEELIAQGFHGQEELLAKVRAESAVVVTHMVIDLSRQRLYAMNRHGQVLAEYKVSTGMRGYATPPGSYQVVNKATYAYSEKYEADMYHWMGLTRNGDIGMHSLKGRGYERRLGRRASHGCIRLSRADARYLFSLVPVGMPVEIVPELDTVEFFQPVTDEDLLELIDELLGTKYEPLIAF
jgi:lipoprotein-anchoring transpeptidase ErfK/SrfK